MVPDNIYKNIDVASLKNAIKACKYSLNAEKSLSLASEIMDANIWYGNTRNNLRNALIKLSSDKYAHLKGELDHCMSVASLIESYQNAHNTAVQLESQYNTLKGKLYYDEEYTVTNYNEETKKYEYETKTRTVKDTNVEAQMNAHASSIEELKRQMNSLHTSINSSF